MNVLVKFFCQSFDNFFKVASLSVRLLITDLVDAQYNGQGSCILNLVKLWNNAISSPLHLLSPRDRKILSYAALEHT